MSSFTTSLSLNLSGLCLAVAIVAFTASPAAAAETAQWSMGDVTVTTASSSPEDHKSSEFRLAATLSDHHHAAVHSSCAVGIPVEADPDGPVRPAVFWTGTCETKVNQGKTVTGTWDGVVRALVQFAPTGKNAQTEPRATAPEKEPFFAMVTVADQREVDAASGVTTLKSTVEVKYYPAATNEHPPCDLDMGECATDKDTSFDAELVISQTFDAAGAKLSKRPTLSLYAAVDKDGKPLPSGAEFEQVDVASGGYVVPLVYVSENKKAVEAGDLSRKKIVSAQHFLWGNPEVTGDLTLVEYDINPATRTIEPFFDVVYFAVKATDTFGNDAERVATLTVQDVKDDKEFNEALIDAHNAESAAPAAEDAAAKAVDGEDSSSEDSTSSKDSGKDEDGNGRVVVSRRALRH